MPRGPNITIENGQTESASLSQELLTSTSIIFIYPPSSLSGEVKPVVSSSVSGTHIPLQSPFGTDIVISAGKAIGIIINKGLVSLRLKTTVAPGADEVYQTSVGLV